MLVNLPVAVTKKGMTLRRIAILDLIEKEDGMHSTQLGVVLNVSRQLIDREVKLLSRKRLLRTDAAKIGTSIKPHRLTAGGVKLLAELRSVKDHGYYVSRIKGLIDQARITGTAPTHGSTKAQNRRGKCEAPEAQ